MTLEQCAAAYIEAHRAGWKNAKHTAQWTATLATYAYPVFGTQPVAAIDTSMVLKVLEPMWTTKTETASRVRGRIESVLDWARVREFRHGENPARWRGHLDHLLPKRSKVAAVKPHAALLLRRMKRDDLTAHGFRSTFRDWAAERTSFPREVAEMALAHTISDKVEAAYRRGDLFKKRRQLAEAWAAFCESLPENIGRAAPERRVTGIRQPQKTSKA
jgi:integrase